MVDADPTHMIAATCPMAESIRPAAVANDFFYRGSPGYVEPGT
jgi:hypothetical protein